MRINDQNLQGLGGTGASGLGSTNRAGGTEGVNGSRSGGRTESTSSDGDRVQLSGLSQALRTEIEDTPERVEKVARLQEAVQSGTYQADAGVVGSKLIDEALGKI